MATAEEIFHADVQRVFATEQGRRVMSELIATHCRGSYDDNPYKMAYNVGKADLVLHLAALTRDQVRSEADVGGTG